MSCTVQEEILKRGLEEAIEELGKEYGLDLKPGSTFTIDMMSNYLDSEGNNILARLDNLRNKWGGSQIYTTVDDMIKITPDISAVITDYLTDRARWDKAHSDKIDYSKLASDKIREKYDSDKKALDKFIFDALNVLNKTRNIKKIDKVFEDVGLSKQRINELITVLNTEEDFADKVVAFATYLLEIKIYATEVADIIEELDGKDNAFYKANELLSTLVPHKDIIDNLQLDLGSMKGNQLLDIFKNASAAINRASNQVVKYAQEESLNLTNQILSPDVQLAINKEEAEIAKMRAQADKANPAVKAMIEERIARRRKKIAELLPTKKNIKDTLLGQAGDISYIGTYIRSILASTDPILQAFAKKLKQIENAVNAKMLNFTNELDTQFKKWQNTTTEKIGMDLEEYFQRFIEEVEEKYYNRKTGTIDSRYTVQLIHETTGEYKTIESELLAKLHGLRYIKNNPELDQDARIKLLKLDPGIPIDEHIAKLDEQYRKFRYETYQQKYTDEYYNTYKLLDVPISVGGVTRTVSELIRPIDRKITLLKKSVRLANGIPSAEQLEALNTLYEEKRKIKSTAGKKPGTMAYEIAKQYQRFQREINKHVSYELTPQDRANYENAFADIKEQLDKGLITKADYNRWIQFNTRRSFKESWSKSRNRLFEAKNQLSQEIFEILSTEGMLTPEEEAARGKISELWEELRAIVNPYRDRNNIINGLRLNTVEETKIYNIENQLEQLTESIVTNAGFTPSQKAKLSDLYNEIKLIEQDAAPIQAQIEEEKKYNRSIKHLVEEIKPFRVRQKEIRAEIKLLKESRDPRIKAKADQLAEINTQLFQLQQTNPTHYYSEAIEKEFNKWFNTESIKGVTEFQTEDAKYKFTDTWYQDSGAGWVEFTGEIINAFKGSNQAQELFKKTNWWKNNHTKSWRKIDDQMVQVEVPTYRWRETVPKSPTDILDYYPGFHWNTRKVDLVNDVALDKKGRPKVRSNKYRNNNYTNMSAPDKEFLDWITSKYLESQDYYPEGMRMNYTLPSLEKNLSIWDKSQYKTSWLKRKFGRGITSTAQDIDTELGDIEGKIAKFQPIRYNNRIDRDMVTHNIVRSITKYIHAANKYEAIDEELIPYYQATRKTLEANTPVAENITEALPKWMKNKAEELGIYTKLTTREGTNNRLKALDEYANMFIYGAYQRKVEGKIFGKNVRIDKIFNNALKAKSFSVLSGSTFAQGANLWGGLINQIVKSTISKGYATFDFKELMRAKKDFYTTYQWDLVNDMGKLGNKSFIGQLVGLLNGIEGRFETYLGEELDLANVKKLIDTDILFAIKNSVELNLSLTTFIAHARTFMLDKGDTKISLFDAFQDHFNRTGKLGVDDDVIWNEDIKTRFTLAQTKMIRDISGAYGSIDKTLLSTTILGQALEWMKKYLVAFFDNMWGNYRFDIGEGRMIVGYHRSGLDGLVNLIQMFAKSDVRDWNFIWQSIDPIRQEGIKQLSTHTLGMSLLYLIVRGLFGYDEDDPDKFAKLRKKSHFENWMLYSILKTQAESQNLIFPFGIDEANKIKNQGLKQTVPYMSEMWKIIYHDINWSGVYDGGDFFEKYQVSGAGYEKGDLKIVEDMYKLVGLGGNRQDPLQRIKNLEVSRKF